ncbi:MAG TPA: hypothetical protein VL461_08895 [Dictyobacter sp.]|nr:hypothetical protein [Dictyobacter sp.]
MKPDDDQRSRHEREQWIAQDETQEPDENHPDVHLVNLLRVYYAQQQQETLHHAWKAIAQYYDAALGAPEADGESNTLHKQSEQHPRRHHVHQTAQSRNASPWGTWLSVAVLLVVLGSFAVLSSHATQLKSTSGPGNQHLQQCPSTATNTSTPSPPMPMAATTPPPLVSMIAATSAPCIKATVTPTVVPKGGPSPTVVPGGGSTPKPMQTVGNS